ncbi:MAG: DUF2207 domain-containing protein [Cyanobacteria bacterium HKST-UBA02]|nr:DUF2207 domain-containing protein [Cyanobacteria bacterium HKST-UBA02]
MQLPIIRSFIFVVLTLVLTAVFLPEAAHCQVIHNFDSVIKINRDRSLDITETIDYDFQGGESHGILRAIPVVYNRNSERYDVAVRVLSVLDESGAHMPWRATFQGNNLILRIGSPKLRLSGKHFFQLRYRVRRAVKFFEGVPEIAWDVTGADWPVTIERARASVVLPKGVQESSIRRSAELGRPQAVSSQPEIETESESASGPQEDSHGRLIRFLAEGIQPGENFTVFIGLPQKSMPVPGPLDDFLFFFGKWWPSVTFPLVMGLMLAAVYWHFGRDPVAITGVEDRFSETFSPRFDMAPAQVGTLIDEKCDLEDIIATVVGLAAEGHLKIRLVVEPGTAGGFERSAYELVKTEPGEGARPLTAFEKLFLDGIFADAKEVDGFYQVTDKDLQYKFFRLIPALRREINESMVHGGYFRDNPDMVRMVYQSLAFFLLFLGVLTLTVGEPVTYLTTGSSMLSPWGIGFCLAAGVSFLFAPAMPARTKKGCDALKEILAFLAAAGTADKNYTVQNALRKDNGLFSRVLPYAMVLGIADTFALGCVESVTEQPDWFEPATSRDLFEPRNYVCDLGICLRALEAVMTAAPAEDDLASHKNRVFTGSSGFGGGGFRERGTDEEAGS